MKTSQTTNNHPVDHSYITKLPTFAERGTAIAKRLEEVKANPKYQALPKERQDKVRASIYKKYVPASYSGFHLPVPDEKTWVGATGTDYYHFNDEKLSDSYGKSKNREQQQDIGAGFQKGVASIKLFGARVANKAFMSMYNLAEHFSHPNNYMTPVERDSYEHKQLENFKKTDTMRAVKNFEDAQKQKIQGADFWLQTHPRDTTIGKLDGSIGENLASLPIYEAMGALGAGEKLVAGASKLSFTAKLAKTPIGSWVSKRLVEATDGFLATLVTSGGDTKEAVGGAVGFAAGGAAVGAASKVIKVASAPLIKKWTANTVAMGGIPFAQELAQSAAHETEQEVAHEGSEIADLKRASQIKDFVKDTTAQAEARTNMVREWKAKQEERAHFDPIMHKLHNGEKVAQDSIALALYGKRQNMLSKNQRALVLERRMSLIKQAASEAPVHLPELHENEVEHEIGEVRKQNPIMNSYMAEFEKMGINFSRAITDANTEVIARETGISNVEAAGNKVVKAVKNAKPKGEKVTSASLNFHIDNSLNYFRAPRNRKQFAELVSYRSQASFDKFYAGLKEANGDLPFKFEKPEHRLLYNYHLSKQLEPKLQRPLREAILRQITKFKAFQGTSLPELRKIVAKEAGYFDNHLHTYARTGELYNGDNIYATTELGGRMSFTKWQMAAERETDKMIITGTQKALKQHPKSLKAFNATIKTLKAQRNKVQTPEEFEHFQSTIEGTAKRYFDAANIANGINFSK